MEEHNHATLDEVAACPKCAALLSHALDKTKTKTVSVALAQQRQDEEDDAKIFWPGQIARGVDSRDAIDYERIQRQARQATLQAYADFRASHPWIEPGQVVVEVQTCNLGVVRASTNPDIEWHIIWLTSSDEPKPLIPVTPTAQHQAILRIGDADEYQEARDLLCEWPTAMRADVYIGEPNPDLFEQQLHAILGKEETEGKLEVRVWPHKP